MQNLLKTNIISHLTVCISSISNTTKTCMQAGIWKAKYLFSVCEKNESLLPTHKHREKNKAKYKGRYVRGERRVSICFLIVRRIVVRLLRVKHK